MEIGRSLPGNGTSRATVLKALLKSGPMARTSIADATHLSRSMITEVSQELIDVGLLQESPAPHSGQRRGRPSVLLSIRAKHAYFVGVNITERPPLMVLTDTHSKVVAEHAMAESDTLEQVVRSIRRGLASLLRSAAVSRDRVLGIGIAISGFVDHRTGICLYSAALNWHEASIATAVQRATRITTYLENDANAFAMAEKLFGWARELDNFSVVTLGPQIGCAHYVQGVLQHGHKGGAGEIAHITMERDGPRCRCGKRGCLDMIAAGNAIAAAAKAQNPAAATVAELEVFAGRGNVAAISLLRKAGDALGLAVASLIQINNPELILFADFEGFGNGVFSTTVRQTVENNILPRFLSSTRLLFHRVDRNALARGAASVAISRYLFERTPN